MKEILVVDDEPRIAEICRDYLQRAGFKVITATTGEDALTLARTRRPDLIVLDLRLPRMDGLDVTRALRNQSNVPIIMLTARVEESDKLIGLEPRRRRLSDQALQPARAGRSSAGGVPTNR